MFLFNQTGTKILTTGCFFSLKRFLMFLNISRLLPSKSWRQFRTPIMRFYWPHAFEAEGLAVTSSFFKKIRKGEKKRNRVKAEKSLGRNVNFPTSLMTRYG